MSVIPFPQSNRKPKPCPAARLLAEQQADSFRMMQAVMDSYRSRRAAAKLAEMIRHADDLISPLGEAWFAAEAVSTADVPPDAAAAAERLRNALAAFIPPFVQAMGRLYEVKDAGLRSVGRR